MRFWLIVIVIFLIAGCSSPMYDFEFDQKGGQVQIKLFKDSTFISHMESAGETYSYAGYWRGNPEESHFSIFATRNGFDILDRELRFSYKLHSGQVTEVSIDTMPPRF